MTTTVPEKAALVMVDMQNDYCNARGVYPRNGLNCFDMDSVVPATVAAVSACKAHAIPVIYLRMAWNTDARGFPIDAGLIIEQSRPFIRTEGLRRGTWGAEVLAEEVNLPYLGTQFKMAGGSIRNAALNAAFLAASERTDKPVIGMRHRGRLHARAPPSTGATRCPNRGRS